MAKMKIPPLKVCFPEEDRRDILTRMDKCLAEGQVAQGENVDEFERLFSEYVGCKHAIAVSNGGCALEAAMHALDVRGKEVLVPTNTFMATAAAVIAAGGTVRLLDIDPETMAPSPETVRTSIGPNTAGVIIVHIGGLMSRDLLAIRSECDAAGVWMFEDAAHAHGSALEGVFAGRIGVGGAYSFFSTKVITSGEGGMLVTDDDGIADRARILRNYGKRDKWITYCEEVSMNWRLNELAAIVGVSQLKRLDEFIEWRSKIASVYSNLLASRTDLTTMQPVGRCSWYKYIVVLPKGIDRQQVRKYTEEQDVRLSGGVYDIPLHKQPVAAKLGWEPDKFPNADAFCDRHICLPLYYGMTEEEAEYVVETLTAAIEKA